MGEWDEWGPGTGVSLGVVALGCTNSFFFLFNRCPALSGLPQRRGVGACGGYPWPEQYSYRIGERDGEYRTGAAS